MPLYDQHVHSRHSVDSHADPAVLVETAIARGLTGITFTEHFDPHPEEWESCVYDDSAYSATIEDLRVRFGDTIFVGKGIEVGYHSGRMGFVLDFLDRHEFDLVMLSSHYFGERALHIHEQWTGVDPVKATRRYIETVLEMVRFCRSVHRTAGRVFHVLGHLDLVKRYTRRFFGMFDLSPFRESIDEILHVCLAADLVPEINTSTLRQDLDEPSPGKETIARYLELGGTAMLLGSDAHRAEHVGADFDRGVVLMREAGLTHAAVFKRGIRIDIPLG